MNVDEQGLLDVILPEMSVGRCTILCYKFKLSRRNVQICNLEKSEKVNGCSSQIVFRQVFDLGDQIEYKKFHRSSCLMFCLRMSIITINVMMKLDTDRVSARLSKLICLFAFVFVSS
jgi:hypothetical protein